MRIYDDQFLLYQETVGPTSFLRDDTRALALIRFVFWSADGQALYLLAFPQGGGLPGLAVYSL